MLCHIYLCVCLCHSVISPTRQGLCSLLDAHCLEPCSAQSWYLGWLGGPVPSDNSAVVGAMPPSSLLPTLGSFWAPILEDFSPALSTCLAQCWVYTAGTTTDPVVSYDIHLGLACHNREPGWGGICKTCCSYMRCVWIGPCRDSGSWSKEFEKHPSSR